MILLASLAAFLAGSPAPGVAGVAQDPQVPAAMRYRCVGPTRGGRVTAVAGVVQQPGTFYMGASGGGVWKTANYGRAWRNVSDGFFASPSIGAIRVAPSDPAQVWVGTGSDGLRSNVIAGCGVYRSADAGATWTFAGLDETRHIGAVEIHPTDPKTVFVAAIGNAFAPNPERGVFRTRDGGETWRRVLFFSPRCGAVDVEFHPADPDTVYACAWRAERKPWTIISGGDEGGVYRSRDGGDTWQRLAGGLPSGPIGKSDLAVTPAAPSRLYVLIEAPGDAGGLYRSEDDGETFEHVSADREIRARPFYYTNVDACPRDADVVYVSAEKFRKSTDGGRTWTSLRTTHGDHHDVWIHPRRPELIVQGNDGGASVTLDGGASWSTLHNQPTAELYQVAVDDRFPYWLYAGQQDNTTIRVPSLPPGPAPAGLTSYWQAVGGCETGPAVPSPVDPNIVYSNCKGRFSVFDFRTGQERRYDVGAANMYGHNPRDLRYRFQRVAPIHVSPHDPDVVYHASQFVHKTTDGGQTWTAISGDLTANDSDTQVISGSPITRDITGEEFYSCLYALRESRLAAGVIWVGSNDGPVHVTRDGGDHWDNVTPADLAPGGRVQCVEPSPHDSAKAYVCVLRYQLGDDRPHVYRTEDFGQSWTRLSDPHSGLPQASPARVVREDPERSGLLYCGTEHGMFVSWDDGGSWRPLQNNLPRVPVTDLAVHRGDLVLATMGRSFWILDDLSPLRQWQQDVTHAPLHLFAPRSAVRARYALSAAVPEYPVASAIFDYWVGAPGDRAELEIRDAGGATVRRFVSGGDAVREVLAVTEMGTETRRERRAVLSAAQGHRRFAWDLRHAATGDLVEGRKSLRGPMVAPGRYEVRLRVGSFERVARFDVQIDPRLAVAGVTTGDLAAQERLALRVRDGLRRAAKLVARIDARRREEGSKGLASLRARLVTDRSIAYAKPQLIDQFVYLHGLLDRGDQRPGRDAELRADELEALLAECEAAMGG